MKQDSFRDFVVEQLRELPRLACRAMFGGYALYSAGRTFGIIAFGKLFFRVDDESRKEYQAAGSGPFTYKTKKGMRQAKNYFEVPIDVLESAPQITEWAERAVKAAEKKAARRDLKKPRRSRR